MNGMNYKKYDWRLNIFLIFFSTFYFYSIFIHNLKNTYIRSNEDEVII